MDHRGMGHQAVVILKVDIFAALVEAAITLTQGATRFTLIGACVIEKPGLSNKPWLRINLDH